MQRARYTTKKEKKRVMEESHYKPLMKSVPTDLPEECETPESQPSY